MTWSVFMYKMSWKWLAVHVLKSYKESGSVVHTVYIRETVDVVFCMDCLMQSVWKLTSMGHWRAFFHHHTANNDVTTDCII